MKNQTEVQNTKRQRLKLKNNVENIEIFKEKILLLVLKGKV